MIQVKQMDMKELVDKAVELKSQIDDLKAEYDSCSAELQARAVSYTEDHNVKFTEFYGSRSLAGVTVAQKVEIMNITTFIETVGHELASAQLTREVPATKYKMGSEFQRAVIAFANGDYCNEFTLEELIDRAGWGIDSKQRRLLLKKLKGDYLKDKETLRAVAGLTENVDEELYYIYQIKNWDLISRYFSHIKDMELTRRKLKSCLYVDETVKVALKEVPAAG